MKKILTNLAYLAIIVLIGFSFAYGGATFSRIKTWTTGETLTAAQLNAEFDNLLNNLDPTGIDDESANDAAAQAISDPYAGSSLVKATSLETEIQQLRYLIAQITGETYWYIDSDTNIATIAANSWVTAARLASNAVETAKIKDANVTTAKIKDANVTTAKLASGSVIPAKINIPAFVVRSQFTWKDADEIYISAGVYEVNGKVVYWDSQLTSDIGSPAVSDWYYLYLDDSAITAGIITTSEIIWANTEPAWSESKHGWYNANDRCIFAVLTDGSSNILKFFHAGNYVSHDTYHSVRALADLDTTWTDINCTSYAPKFSTRINITATLESKSATSDMYALWRPDGDSGAGFFLVSLERVGTDQKIRENTNVITNSSQVFEASMSIDGTDELGVFLNGWYFPIGM